jgi:hypothetical protein
MRDYSLSSFVNWLVLKAISVLEKYPLPSCGAVDLRNLP